MTAPSKKNVSRETNNTLKGLLDLFLSNSSLMKSFSLLKHRSTLGINVSNTSFLLIWLRIAKDLGYFPVVLFRRERDAESFYADILGFFIPERVSWIPLFGSASGLRDDAALENHISRFLSDYYGGKVDVVLSSAGIFDQRVADKKSLRRYTLQLKAGEPFGFSALPGRLESMGYRRGAIVEYCGEYAIRGGIVDIYPYGETYPLRIEFFGDTIESLRSFNPNDQNAFEICEHAEVRPASFSDYSNSTIGNMLPENTLVIRIVDPGDSNDKPVYDSGIAHRQVSFGVQDPAADLRFSLIDIDVPHDINDVGYYNKLISKHKRIFVLSEHDLVLEAFREKLGDHAVYLPLNVSVGFIYKDLDLVLLSGREMFHKEHYENPNKRFIPERSTRIDSLESLVYGDIIVHVDYGIGIYRGIELLEFRGVEQEAMVVEYQNRDKVYVSVRHMNKIFKYSNEKNSQVPLDRIGGNRWEQTKTTTRKYLRETAYDLVSLYRDRKKLQGFAFSRDTPDAIRLEATFPYDETRDQRQAIEDISSDMEKPRIMDRLVCGDVGFGKTEVAIRAAFKAVYSGKQVAVLVPTTILCFQHYETFHERLKAFGIHVEYINRFVAGSKFVEKLNDLGNGRIDVLVGTHKILSNNLYFKDLGLLIIDEEHRFGVNHKEKIQNLKRRVDVITLTATPIPRTLQLSLAGLRDITKIDTPPRERLPISTKIMYWDNRDIGAAIDRELERNGQVFILHNSIEQLPALRDKVAAMFPSHGVRIAHGKMPGNELEKTLLDFYHHRYDILISTTIIESGIDIPNANTLIVMNAHRFGLSQLYQIRGRVGRSYKKAYAYLVIPRGKHINPSALKRLQTLEYYTDLGSGYEIAIRDLEIRGAGSLFGAEQSGHINRLGYAYFNRMFSEEVDAAKKGEDLHSVERRDAPDIQLQHPAYFPETYIENKDIRISFYRELSEILNGPRVAVKSELRLDRLIASCRDRFGNPPPQTHNLFFDARLALWLKSFHIESFSRKQDNLHVIFREGLPVDIIRDAAGKLLHVLSVAGVSIGFISKKHLAANIDLSFLDLFNAGTFADNMDSKPVN